MKSVACDTSNTHALTHTGTGSSLLYKT